MVREHVNPRSGCDWAGDWFQDPTSGGDGDGWLYAEHFSASWTQQYVRKTHKVRRRRLYYKNPFSSKTEPDKLIS